MCCCGKPVINGQPGFKWQPNDAPRIHPVNPPALDEYETLLYDEPGRCGGLDAHCHHYRVASQGTLKDSMPTSAVVLRLRATLESICSTHRLGNILMM